MVIPRTVRDAVDRPSSGAELGRLGRIGGAVGLFFGLKIATGLVLVSASAHRLNVSDFGIFSQLFLLLGLLATVSAGGVQNGLVRRIALAGGAPALERQAVAAALCITGGFGVTLVAVALLFQREIALVLTGSAASAWTIPLIAVAAIVGGFGAILCAVLTGRGRAPVSLMLQAAGLVAGGAGAFYALARGDAIGAVLAFACGPMLTFILALGPAHSALPRRLVSGRLRADVRELLGFSGAFLLVAAIMPLTLFGLRYVYRLDFGPELLGYWLAGNRVSDITSQLLGLFMQQFFLPRAAVIKDMAAEARPLIGRTFLICTAMMAAGLIVFALGQEFFVRTFLSAQFLPAIPFIIGYLAGDVLRVATSLAMHLALARGRLLMCIGIEAASAATLAIFMLILAHALRRADGAYMAYVLANASMATILAVGWGRKNLQARWTRGRS